MSGACSLQEIPSAIAQTVQMLVCFGQTKATYDAAKVGKAHWQVWDRMHSAASLIEKANLGDTVVPDIAESKATANSLFSAYEGGAEKRQARRTRATVAGIAQTFAEGS